MSDRTPRIDPDRYRKEGHSTIAPDLARWTAHEALDEAIGSGRTRRRLAERLGVSRSLIDQWCEGRARNPVERLRETVQFLRDQGHPDPQAMLAVVWLLDELGYQPPAPKGGAQYPGGISTAAARVFQETADMTEELVEALSDGEIDPIERKRILREAREVQRAVLDLVGKLEQGWGAA